MNSFARQSTLIVGVGASAGGLEAFAQSPSSLGVTPGFAIAFVQHPDPKGESLLVADWLSRLTPAKSRGGQ